MFLGIIPLMFVLKDLEFTIGGYNLFWKLSFLSILFSLSVLLILNKKYNLLNEKKFDNLMSFTICFFFLIPALGIFLNTYFTNGVVYKQSYFIKQKAINESAKGSKTYIIYIKTKYDDEERLEITKDLYKSDYQNVELTLKKGLIGYYYVNQIEGH